MNSVQLRHYLRRGLAVFTVMAMLTAVLAALAPVLALAADCPTTYFDPNCGKDDPPPQDLDPCNVMTHIPAHCVEPDPEPDPDNDPDPCNVMTHIPDHCVDPDPGDDVCPDLDNPVFTHVVEVPEECLNPDPGDGDCPDGTDPALTHRVDVPEECLNPDSGDEPEPEDDRDGDDITSSGTGPDPQSAPDLPNTGGNYFAYALSGGAMTVAAAVSLFRSRRREDD